MLKFIDENDFLLVDTFKENEDGSVSWIYDEGEDKPTHSGIICEGFMRTAHVEIDVWARLLELDKKGLVSVQWMTEKDHAAIAQEKQRQSFKSERQLALDTAVVTTSDGFKFDADERSITRMSNAISAAERAGRTDVRWSLADTATGVMTDITLQDLQEAHTLAVENMESIWEV